MNDLENSISYSLDGSDNPDIYPFLPYILRDLWELGALPKTIIDILKRNNIPGKFPGLKILDLGCGKGAVSIYLAKEFGAVVHGVDGLADFINEANQKASEWGVDHLCSFETGDIREYTKQKHKYDVVILAAVGYVLGNVEETISALSNCINPNGFIVIDDGYIPDNTVFPNNIYIKESDYFNQLNRSNFEIVDTISIDESEMESMDSEIFEKIKRRVAELILKYPDKRTALEKYLLKQESENNIIENYVKNFSILLKRKQDVIPG
ncbi:MAG: methyltransferase domain-containing protein [Ignavibacteriaceae bacterium]